MKVVDSAEMAAIDRQAQGRYRIPESILMEDAGVGMYRLLRERLWGQAGPRGPVLFLAGKGNNGGDALVMARQARLDGLEGLAVVLAGEPKAGGAPAANLAACAALGIEIIDYGAQPAAAAERASGASWIVDGLLGTGLRGEARGAAAELVRLANGSRARRVAVDVPSGLGDAFLPGYTVVEAEATLTVALPKRCLYLPAGRSHAGEILVVPGVFPQELLQADSLKGELLDTHGLAAELPVIPPDTYKTRRGHVAAFAGGRGTTGAAWLATTAAGRSRSGLATLFAEEELYPALVAKFGSVMVRPWREADDPAETDLGRYTALLVGPGWGLSEGRRRWLEQLIDLGVPGALDADGVTLLGGMGREGEVDLGGRWVLTPHPGEFARLLGRAAAEVLADPWPPLLEASRRLNAVIVLKGHCTTVASPEGRYWILDGGNPAMATGGSGDVLAGIVAGLLATGMSPVAAARAAVMAHSAAGRRAFAEKGYFLAEDLLPYVSQVLSGEAGW